MREITTRLVSILSWPEGQLQPTPVKRKNQAFRSFNPQLARRPTATVYRAWYASGEGVSILSWPEGQLQLV